MTDSLKSQNGHACGVALGLRRGEHAAGVLLLQRLQLPRQTSQVLPLLVCGVSGGRYTYPHIVTFLSQHNNNDVPSYYNSIIHKGVTVSYHIDTNA